MDPVHVDLLDLVADDHDEAGHVRAHACDHRVPDALRRTETKGAFGAGCHQGLGNMSYVAVAPALIPDRCDVARVLGPGGTKGYPGHGIDSRRTAAPHRPLGRATGAGGWDTGARDQDRNP